MSEINYAVSPRTDTAAWSVSGGTKAQVSGTYPGGTTTAVRVTATGADPRLTMLDGADDPGLAGRTFIASADVVTNFTGTVGIALQTRVAGGGLAYWNLATVAMTSGVSARITSGYVATDPDVVAVGLIVLASGRSAGNTITVTNAMVNEGIAALPFFDGNTAETATDYYRWLGTANLSRSAKAPQSDRLTLTPMTAFGTVLIDVDTSGGKTLKSVTRSDANGSRPVRVAAGVLPSATPPILVDYEPALVGNLTYKATFTDGTSATKSVVAPTTSKAWLNVPVAPQYSAAVDLVTGYSADRRSGNVLHEVIDRPDPAVTLGPLRWRDGLLEVWCADYATARVVEGVHDRGQVLMLRQPTYPGMDMYYVVSGSVTTTPLTIEHRPRWRVAIGYTEVARPADALTGALGWTFEELATTYSTFGQVAESFETFDDLTTNTPVTP